MGLVADQSQRVPDGRNFVSNSSESVRMFERDWMEALSKVHWSVPLFLYVPTVLFLLWFAHMREAVSPIALAAWFTVGLVAWTPAEYLLHRFVFHWVPPTAIGKRLHFIFHGVHHDYPSDAKRLVMPPAASIPLALAIYGLFRLLLPSQALHGFTAGFMTGYLVYDMMHYALHHALFQHPLLKALKRQHMVHHYRAPDRGYGVSSPLWDYIFGTPHKR